MSPVRIRPILFFAAMLWIAAVPLAAETYSVAFDAGDNAEKLLLIDDPASPAEIGSGFANCCSTLPDLSAINQNSNVLYFVAADVVQRNLYWFDLSSGATNSLIVGFFNYYWLGWDSDNDRILTVYNNTINAEWRLATLDPQSGGPSNIGNPFASCCTSAITGAQAVDGDDDRFYFLAKATMGDTTSWRVYEINTGTGAIVSDHTLPTANTYHFLEIDLSTDTLYLLYRDGANTERMATYDPSTGTLGSPIGPGIGTCCNTPAGSVSAIDSGRDVISFVAATTASNDRRLFTIETTSGAYTSALLSSAYTYSFLEATTSLYGNGFEAGNTTAWSNAVP